MPTTSWPSRTDQTVTPDPFSPDRSSANTLSGGELACMPARCSASRRRVGSLVRSSTWIENMAASRKRYRHLEELKRQDILFRFLLKGVDLSGKTPVEWHNHKTRCPLSGSQLSFT